MTLAVLTFGTAQDLLAPDEIVERLRAEFEDVHVDADAGRRHATRELELLRQINAPADIVDMVERGVAGARWVTIREGDASVAFMLMPEANIRMDHDASTHHLIQRCAATLNCHVEECC